jgi:hypothetical protein
MQQNKNKKKQKRTSPLVRLEGKTSVKEKMREEENS